MLKRFLLAALILVCVSSSAFATISRVGASTGTTTCTPATHNIGDVILIWAFDTSANTSPTTGAGFTSLQSGTGNTSGWNLGFKIATATNDSSGTWTNATAITCIVYTTSLRGASGGYINVGGGGASNSGATTTINYPAVSMFNANSSSWVVGVAASRSTTNSLTTHAPAGMTTIGSADLINTCEVNAFDTNGTVSSWSSTNTTVTTATGWATSTVELVEVGPVNIPSNIVQHMTWSGNAVAASGEKINNIVLPFAKTTGLHDTIQMVLVYPNTATLSSITDDSGSNTWSTTPNKSQVGGTMTIAQFEVDNAATLTKITVNWTASTQPVLAWLTELTNVTGFNSGAGATSASGTTNPKILGGGTFTPTNNNANGGTVIFQFCAIDFTNSGVNVSQWDKQNQFTLMDADNAWTQGQGVPKASQVFLQTTAAAITPQFQANHTGSIDPYVCISVALNVGVQGTAPSAFRILRMIGFANSGVGSTQALQVPSNGNSVGIGTFIETSSASDTEGVSWTVNNNATLTNTTWITRQNATANDVRSITINNAGGTGGAAGFYYFDIAGADPSAFHDYTAVGSTSVTNGVTSIAGQTSITPTVTGATLTYITNGIGPTGPLTVPVGSFYLFPTYTGLGDSGQMALGNGLGVFYQNNLSNQNWTWGLANSNVATGSYVSGTGVVTIDLSTFFDSAFTGADIFITLTGTGSVASLNGHFVVGTDNGTGTHFTYTATTGLTLTITGGNVTQFNISVQSAAITVKQAAAAAVCQVRTLMGVGC